MCIKYCGKSFLFQKLNRRQRAFEVLIQSADINAEVMDRYRLVLSREFTSSDEEVDEEKVSEGSEGGAGAAGDEDSQLLRVRKLTWESDEVVQMKQHLDSVYMERFCDC